MTYDERPAVPQVGDEWETLCTFLDFGRATLLMKCAGLSGEQLRERAIPPSGLSLLGILRHMTDVERGWFSNRFAQSDIAPRYYTDDRLNDDFDDLESHGVDDVVAAFLSECDVSRAVLAASRDLDAEVTRWDGSACSLRWILMHMIEEYARHNGHADLLRERIDGTTGS